MKNTTFPEIRSNYRLSDEVFDIVIIGAGIVGCAIARRFTLEGARVAMVEKATDILDGASKANSAILHTGFDAPKNSLELDCIKNGYREYIDIHNQLGLPLENTTAHVVAWNGEEEARLDQIVEQAHANGVDDVSRISASDLIEKEPNLAGNAVGAISIPGESIIDPWSAPYAYLHQSILNGGEVFLSCEVIDGEFDDETWSLETTRGIVRSRHVINCAGLYGDRIDEKLLGEAKFHITPRKGQFVVFDKAALKLINSIILPVPTERTKGVVVCRTIFGNVLVGPTAEDQNSRSDTSTDCDALRGLIASGIEKLPGLEYISVTAVYAGLRPASEFKDYQIEAKADKKWITVGGIRSTGLSGALGIASYVFDLYAKTGPGHKKLKAPKVPQASVLARLGERSWKQHDHGEIVCHCELVTEQEINKAMHGPLRARSLSGLKRKTRVTMGRCQGFYCSARLAELSKGKFELPIAKDFQDD